jgi:hypothetical protein
MASATLDRLLARLQGATRRFDPRGAAVTERLLRALGHQRYSDPVSLIRLHEKLLFLRVYPPNIRVMRQAEGLLSSFAQRVAALGLGRKDLSPFDRPEVSGIAGTSVTEIFGYDVVRWLLRRFPGRLRAEWEGYEPSGHTAAIWPRFLPLLHEESLVEANVPYLKWLQAASGRGDRGLPWLIQRLESLPLSTTEAAELYDSLEIPVRWDLRNTGATRTRNRRPAPRAFCHRAPLIRRTDISLAKELQSPRLPVAQLSRTDGERILDMGREGMAVRHRELYAFTYGDPRYVLRADAGRGVEIFICGLLPSRRLPLRAYHGFLIYKNGVQVGYGDLLTFFERTELAFNHYPAFREGESAWIYARLLRLLRQVFGVACFSVDPYQIGFQNEEAIESGAFWFYRKLGFRPLTPEVARLVEAEERKIGSRPGYRTPDRTLRRIAMGHVVYEAPGSSRGTWDRFHIRNIGLAVQRRMARDFRGDPERIRSASLTAAMRVLGMRSQDWGDAGSRMLEDFALVLTLIPGLERWTDGEKARLGRIIRAKLESDELRYVRLLRSHPRLRQAMLSLGSPLRGGSPEPMIEKC